MPSMRVLVVDDEVGMLEVYRDTLDAVPELDVVTESDSRAAAKLLAEESFDLLIVDNRMPGLGGIELLRIAHEQDPELRSLMVTAFPTVDSAVESMKIGATDYLTKPFHPDKLLAIAQRLLEDKRLRDENRLLRRQVERSHTMDEMVGESSAMRSMFDLIRRVAETDADTLILGETGTGKELVARSIHQRSRRSGGGFVPVDCGAIPESLLESEFFGHERGAYTGAQGRNIGLFEYASKGTFFLDEIGELPRPLQAKLLRVLQERKIRRVGGREEIDIDVRVLAATSRDLETEVREGRFREDLYYRINVARIDVPPLRERLGDVAILTDYFISRFAADMSKENVSVETEFIEVLSGYSWPGNVRQLLNAIKRALAMARSSRLSVDDLPDEIVMRAREPVSVERGFFEHRAEHIDRFESEYLTELLRARQGDVSSAAKHAGLPRGTLYRLLKKHGIHASQFRD